MGTPTIFWTDDWKGLEFDHYPDHQKITLKWAQVEKYIDLMIQSDRYLTDKEKEHYTPPCAYHRRAGCRPDPRQKPDSGFLLERI